MAKKILNGLDLAGQRIINVGDPSVGTDAVNLQTAQNLARGLSATKLAVRAASTANITVASPGASIDGVTLVAGDRILLKDQTTTSQNGIYVWNGAAVAATRALDADAGSELQPGTNVFVTEGTVNADRQYLITSDVVIVVGTTAMTWTQFGGGNTYTGSNGVVLSGSDFRGVVAPAGGLTVGASGFSIDTSVVSRKISGSMGNGSLTVIGVPHNLGTLDVDVTLREIATNAGVETDWVATDVNTVTFTFATAPTTSSIRWTIQG
jgi:hypothetical protein